MQDKQTSLTITNIPTSLSKQIVELNTKRKLSSFKGSDELKQLDQTLVVIAKSLGAIDYDKDVRLNTIAFLIENYGDFSIEEIKKAINTSVTNEIDFHGKFSLLFISKCLNDYRERRKDVLFELKKQSNVEVLEIPNKNELELKIINNLPVMFLRYKEKKEITDYGNITYNLLERLKIINLTPEKKKIIYQQAKMELSKSLTLEKIKHGNELFKLAFDKMITEIRNGENNQIIVEAKRKALAVFFDEIIKNNVQIEQLVETCNERRRTN